MNVCKYVCAWVHMHNSEDKLWKQVLSFHHVVIRDLMQISRFCEKCLYPLSHLASLGGFITRELP